MNSSLNYDKHDPKYILLGKIFKIIDNNKTKDTLNRYGIRNRKMMVICIKIFFISLYFSCEVSYVVSELNRSNKLRKFARIESVPNENQVYEYFSRYNEEQYIQITNSILNTFFRPHKKRKDIYIVDATPVECDFNIVKKFITLDHLNNLNLKWGYATTKGHYIGYKVTVVLEKRTLTPVSILIHSGAPHDSKIFDEVLSELERRGIIKEKDMLYFDRGYFSRRNYEIGLNKYHIVPIIFPKKSMDIDKFKDQISFPLTIYKNKKEFEKKQKLIKHLARELFIKLENWEELKPERGIIEDFFKVAKDAFGMGKFHSFTEKSMYKNITLCLLLTTIVVQTGFKTKTQLQQLSEGIVVLQPPKTKKRKNKKNKQQKTKKSKAQNKIKQTKLEITTKGVQSTLQNWVKI